MLLHKKILPISLRFQLKIFDDQLVREKYIDLEPMTEEEALVQTDLLGHDFYVFVNSSTGLTNVIYHVKWWIRNYQPKIEEQDVQ